MANVYVEESTSLKVQSGLGTIPIPADLLATTKNGTIGASSAKVVTLNAKTRFMLVSTDTDLEFAVVDAGGSVSDSNARFIPAGGQRFVAASGGSDVVAKEKA